MREKYGKAFTLKFWEMYVSAAWQVQNIGYFSLSLAAPTPHSDRLWYVSPEPTTGIGIVLVVVGVISTSSAIYMTGYNNYFMYDMILNIPNAYFIKGGIYKFCSSPMYSLGKLYGFGLAIMFRSTPGVVAAAVDVLYINFFNYFVEKPFIKKMYGCGKSSKSD